VGIYNLDTFQPFEYPRYRGCGIRANQGEIMSVDIDIAQFVAAIGAEEPSQNHSVEIYQTFRSIFRRPNYFVFNKKAMIVKISRIEKPFWGVGKKYIDIFNSQDDYYLVLLVSSREGWVFTKSEVNSRIINEQWKLEGKKTDYKIHFPLPDRNSFFSPENFLRKDTVARILRSI
jgi:hypothetical protein